MLEVKLQSIHLLIRPRGCKHLWWDTDRNLSPVELFLHNKVACCPSFASFPRSSIFPLNPLLGVPALVVADRRSLAVPLVLALHRWTYMAQFHCPGFAAKDSLTMPVMLADCLTDWQPLWPELLTNLSKSIQPNGRTDLMTQALNWNGERVLSCLPSYDSVHAFLFSTFWGFFFSPCK